MMTFSRSAQLQGGGEGGEARVTFIKLVLKVGPETFMVLILSVQF